MRDQPTGSSPWMNLRQGSHYTKVSAKLLRREIRAGRLRAARVGGRREIRLRQEWLDTFIEGADNARQAARDS